jgi:1,4-alpha-glucan branching enzyme
MRVNTIKGNQKMDGAYGFVHNSESGGDTVRAPGKGAILHEGGCTFRVWAPNADGVKVRVTAQNSDTPLVADLEKEENGVWATNIAGAQPGQSYKFLVTSGEETFERIDPYAREVTNSVGEGVIIDPNAFDWQGIHFELPPHNELVIYEMHVGSFVAKEGETGQFATALKQLDHLKKLGVNAIQIMPVGEFAGDKSWGYNPAHIFAVESAYGGPEGLKTFVRECHRSGIAVILDVVFNHFGPSDLGLWRFDGWNENDGGGIYFYNDPRAETPWGNTRPDYGRGEVRQFMRDNIMMWLNDYHINGLRYDSTLYMRSMTGDGNNDLPEGWSLLQWLNDEMQTVAGRHISIAEDLHGLDAIVAGADEGGAGFNAQWDANFVHPVRAAVVTPEDGDRSMDAIRDAIMFRYCNDAFRRIIYSESHDEVANGKARVPHEIDEANPTGWAAQKRSTLAAALVFTSPGIPMLFQGQEFLQGEWFRDDVPLDWNLNSDFKGIVRLYHDLIALRLNRSGDSRGLMGQNVNVFHVNDDANVLAFHRFDGQGPGDDVVVVMNFSTGTRGNYRIGFPAAGNWQLRLNSDAAIYSPDFSNGPANDIATEEHAQDGFAASANLDVPPYSTLIFTRIS